jgi:hypothetical protein
MNPLFLGTGYISGAIGKHRESKQGRFANRPYRYYCKTVLLQM